MTAGMQDHFFDSGGVRLHAVSIGEGPLVVFCHGFPGLWYSWRHQLTAVGDYGRPFALPHIKPSDCFAAIAERHFFHMHYFQTIGPAERELGPKAAEFLQRLYWSLSAQGNLLGWDKYPSAGTGYLDVLAAAPPLPWRWLDETDFDYITSQYLLAGEDLAFIGGLNSYRVADRNWELGEPWADARIEVPSLFIAGHFVQLEQAEAFNRALLDFVPRC